MSRTDAAPGDTRPSAVRWIVGDWSRFSPQAGIVAALLVVGVLLAVRTYGAFGLVVALAAVQGVMLAVPLKPQARVPALLAFALLGGVVTALGQWVGSREGHAVGVLVVVAFLAGLTTAAGPVTNRVVNVVAIWFLTVVVVASSLHDPLRVTLGFVAGVLALAALAWLLPKLRRGAHLVPPGDEPTTATLEAVRRQLTWQGGALPFATVLAVAAGLALALGWRWFPSHPHWAAATVLLLLRPDPGASLLASLQRMAGTLVGGAVVVWAVSRVDDPRLLLGVLLVAAFLTAATVGVGQAVFSVFITLLILTMIAISGGDSAGSAAQRVAEVVLGVSIAVGATVLLQWLPKVPTGNAPGLAPA